MRVIFAAAAFIAPLGAAAYADSSHAQYIIENIQEMSGPPGVSAAVAKDGKLVWTGEAGVTDTERKTPVKKTTQFRTASVAKLFATTMALKLVEDGRIDVDADIRTYVPDWPDHGGAVITLRQLAAHTSGIAHYLPDDNYDPARGYSTLNDSLSIYADRPLRTAPGEQYHYSSYGFALIGAAIENVAGMSFADYLAATILLPLSLEHTIVEHASAPAPGASKLYALETGEIAVDDQKYVLGATGLLSTSADLVRFGDAYMRGEIVDQALVDMSVIPVRLNNGEKAGIPRFDVGFGWRLSDNWEGERVYHHSGGTYGARSVLIHNPERGTTAALMSNAEWVTRVETTGGVIATAATEGADVDLAECPIGTWRYSGIFNPELSIANTASNASGVIEVNVSEGMCVAKIAPEGAIAQWMREQNARKDVMNAVLISRRPGGHVFAVVAPWGAFPLLWSDNAGAPTFAGDFAGRTVALTLTREGGMN